MILYKKEIAVRVTNHGVGFPAWARETPNQGRKRIKANKPVINIFFQAWGYNRMEIKTNPGTNRNEMLWHHNRPVIENPNQNHLPERAA